MLQLPLLFTLQRLIIYIYRFQPPPLTIELSLDAGSNDSYLSGTYLQGIGPINEKPFWLQQNGSHAIWYHWYVSGWMIGEVSYLGQFKGKIYVNEDINSIYPNNAHSIIFNMYLGIENHSGNLHLLTKCISIDKH